MRRGQENVVMQTILRFALAALLLATPAAAQDYPTKPVTIVIPFAAGGAGDILARLLSPRLEKSFGRPFVVENKPGAGGVIGAVATARAEADGHTIMIAPSPTMAVNVTLFKKLPYDPAADFVPLAMAAQTPFVLVVNPSLPIKSVADLIKYVKEQKGKVSYATAGPGVPHHLFAELLKSMTGIEMSPVPYKGSVPAITDVVAGPRAADVRRSRPALSIIQEGRVRAVGVSTAARVPAIPDVPPINDAVKGFDVASWQMVVAPAKTPRAIVDRLHAELKKELATPEVSGQIAKTGMLPMDTPTVEGLQAFVKSEIARWGKVVQQAGIAGSQ
jgi:tripartite-type tricarboxylate transporter receptor subunit TctC